MTAVIRVKGLKGLARALQRDLGKKLHTKILRAVKQAARDTEKHVYQNVPVAFNELRASIHYVNRGRNGASVIADAPHSVAVEIGARPGRMPPIDAIARWVQLRGMQGLGKGGINRPSKGPGTTTAFHSMSIASSLRAMRVYSAGEKSKISRLSNAAYKRAAKQSTPYTGRFRAMRNGMAMGNVASAIEARERRREQLASKMGTNSVKDASRLAWAIAKAIQKRGTKPQFYMRRSVSFAMRAVSTRVRAALGAYSTSEL